MRINSDKKIPVSERIKSFLSGNWRICIYTLCGLGLCWIDLWRGIGNGAQWSLAVNCTGFCILPLIIFRLDWRMLSPGREDTVKWHKLFRAVFYGWLILFAILAYPAFRYFAPGTDYDAQIATAVANVGLYGAIVVRMYFYLFYERKESEESYKNEYKVIWIFWLWLAFIVFAIISVNEAVWPLWFLVMFGSFYLAPLKKGDMEEIFEGLVNGMIIGFFWIQSRAFLYRPYDLDPRYRGHYTNPNVNAMFYMTTYIAWLGKLTIYRMRKARKLYAFTFFMASAMWCFVFFTNCRSAMMGFAGATLVYWFIESRYIGRNRVLSFFSRGAIMLFCAAISFMPVYWCMRYIPPLRHHPIWYGGEYCENSVMSWDPIDSPKYMDLEYIVGSDFGRVYLTIENETGDSNSYHAVASLSDETFDQNIYSDDGEEVLRYADGIAPGADEDHPVYVVRDFSGNLLKRLLKSRYYIYLYALKNIHFFGNENHGAVWIFTDFALYHAHNSALQIAYWFGGISGLLFLGLLLVSSIKIFLRLSVEKNTRNENGNVVGLVALLAITAYMLAGFTECIAFPGEMGMTLFFVSLLPIVRMNCE